MTGVRVNLRALQPSDAAAIHRHMTDRRVARWLPRLPRPYTLDDARSWIQITRKMAAITTDYHYGIEDPGTGEIIGMIGLNNVNWNDCKAEVGYWLAHKYWGQGLMSEALGLMETFAFRRLRLRRVHAFILETNAPSIAVLERAGYRREVVWRESRRQGGRWLDLHTFALLRGEYEGRANQKA